MPLLCRCRRGHYITYSLLFTDESTLSLQARSLQLACCFTDGSPLSLRTRSSITYSLLFTDESVVADAVIHYRCLLLLLNDDSRVPDAVDDEDLALEVAFNPKARER